MTEPASYSRSDVATWAATACGYSASDPDWQAACDVASDVHDFLGREMACCYGTEDFRKNVKRLEKRAYADAKAKAVAAKYPYGIGIMEVWGFIQLGLFVWKVVSAIFQRMRKDMKARQELVHWCKRRDSKLAHMQAYMTGRKP